MFMNVTSIVVYSLVNSAITLFQIGVFAFWYYAVEHCDKTDNSKYHIYILGYSI